MKKSTRNEDEIDRIVNEHNTEVEKKEKRAKRKKMETKKMSKLNSKTIAIIEGMVIGAAILLAAGFYLGMSYADAKKQEIHAQAKIEAKTLQISKQ